MKDEEFLQLESEPDRVENLALLCLDMNMSGGWDEGLWLAISGSVLME